MRVFSDEQKDVLLEVCNIGMSKSAKQLSVLLNGPVLLATPEIELVDFDHLSKYVMGDTNDVISMVHQELTRDFTGNVVLLLKRDYTQFLLEQVVGEIPTNLSDKEKRSCEKEAMLEIGNILISSCTTAIANMFSKKVALTVPSYAEGKFQALLDDERNNFQEVDTQVVIILSTTLSTKRGDFSGRLMLLLSSETINKILEVINDMV
ncbi:MAG: chemotaxis protein CheC [Legionellaceae bacterium]|nr:chemotaxis protein CheC [Legionellaceae bacterium]